MMIWLWSYVHYSRSAQSLSMYLYVHRIALDIWHHLPFPRLALRLPWLLLLYTAYWDGNAHYIVGWDCHSLNERIKFSNRKFNVRKEMFSGADRDGPRVAREKAERLPEGCLIESDSHTHAQYTLTERRLKMGTNVCHWLRRKVEIFVSIIWLRTCVHLFLVRISILCVNKFGAYNCKVDYKH